MAIAKNVSAITTTLNEVAFIITTIEQNLIK